MRTSILRRAGATRRIAVTAAAAMVVPALMLGSSPSGAAAPTFGEPQRVSGSRGFEQGVNLLDDGTIFVDEPSGLGSHSKLWRWDPNTAAPEPLSFTSPYHRLPGGGDSDVAVTPDGRVYFLDLWLGSNSIAVSEDRGDTWTMGTPFTSLPLSDRQWIAVGKRDPTTGKDTVYVVYKHLTVPNAVHTNWFARSRDGGLTWDFHTPAPFFTSGGSTGKLVADGDFVAFTYKSSNRMQLAWSTNAGDTWNNTQISVLNDAPSDITPTALAGDNVYTAWVKRSDGAIRFARSSNRGQEFTIPADIPGTGGGTGVFAWLAARGNKVAIAWYATPSVAGGPDNVPSTAEWSVKYVESKDYGATWSPAVSVGGLVKRGIICTQGLGCNSGREVGDFMTLAIDANMKSVVTYYDGYCETGGVCGGGLVARQTS